MKFSVLPKPTAPRELLSTIAALLQVRSITALIISVAFQKPLQSPSANLLCCKGRSIAFRPFRIQLILEPCPEGGGISCLR